MDNIKSKITMIFDIVLSKYVYAYIFVFYSFIKTFKVFMNQKIPTYFIIFYGIIVLCYKFTDVKNKFGKINEILPSIFIVSSTIISIVISRVYNYENIKIVLIFVISLFVLLPEDINDNDDNIFKKLYIFCLLVSIMFFIYTVISFLYYIIAGNVENRPMGMLNELTYFAQSIVACIGASIYCLIYSKNKYIKLFEISNFVFQSFVLFLTLQRGSLYGYLIAIVLLMILLKNKFNGFSNKSIKKNAIVILLLFAFVFIFLVISNKFSIKVMIDRFTSGLNLREYIYKFGFLAMIYYNNFLFGATRGGIYNVWHNYLNVSYDLWKVPYEKYSIVRGCIDEVAIHSTVLEQLFVHGVFGLLSLLYLYFKIVYNVFISVFKKRLTNDQLALVASSLFCLIAVMFDSFFNRALLFDIVYPQNLCFFVFAGASFRLIDSNKMKVVN